MTKTILGISAYYHDSAAAIIQDGRIIAAAQEERFTRKKHDAAFPRHAVNYCLGEAFIEPRDLEAVVFYDNPMLTLDRAVRNFLAVAPKGEETWTDAVRTLLGPKARLSETIQRELAAEVPVLFTLHHFAHAASAYYPSPFDEAAILTIDGVGEWTTTTIGHGVGGDLRLLREIRYPHSLGLLYSAFTTYCGFKVNSGEYKLMGLAPYGKPRYADLIREHLIDILPDGSFRLAIENFGFLDSNRMTNEAFDKLFGGPARAPESRITRREMDLAASVQAVTEEIVLKLAQTARDITGSSQLVLAGGVALNCVANGHIQRAGLFEQIWVQPAAGDAGGALGGALHAYHERFGGTRSPVLPDGQQGTLLGPRFSSAEIRAFLDRKGLPYRRVEDPAAHSRLVAAALAEGQVVGHFAGRMEFGPRALGSRSILGDPRRPDMQSRMNLKIKFRESFRPFAPAVLVDHASEYFELGAESPYMLLVAPIRLDRRQGPEDAGAGSDDMLTIINAARSDIPAVTHVDHSARVQTVDGTRSPEFRRLLEAFHEATGCAVLINTSFNVRGEPIVCTPEDAYRCFMRTGMDLLVLEDCILRKEEQPDLSETNDWRHEFDLD